MGWHPSRTARGSTRRAASRLRGCRSDHRADDQYRWESFRVAPSPVGGFQLLLSEALLPVALADREFVWIETPTRHAAMLAAATVADDHVADEPVIKQTIDRGGAEQYRPGDPL